MKNLKLLNHSRQDYSELSGIKVISQLYDNVDELLLGHNLTVSKVNTKTSLITRLFDICDLIPVSVGEVEFVNLAYFTVEHLLVCALNNGCIIKFDLETSQIIDVVDVFPQGIQSMKVSPDNELLAFVTSDNNVHLTDCRLEVLNTSSLLDEKFGQGEFINVGWGKKETQFHGSEGKEAAKRTVVIEASNCDDHENETVITWRGDSSLFSVGHFHNSLCRFKVFDKEGTLQYTSEKQPGLECNFSWRPSGNLIATTQVLPNKYVIAFFEKNGLKHGEFMLPFNKSEYDIKSITWSADSEVLNIWCNNASLHKSFLLFYTTNNYHWYLKNCLVLEDTEISFVGWDESNVVGSGKYLHVFLKNGSYLNYNYVWSVDRSKGKTINDKALVGVVDGKNLLLTSFKKAVVPPPMAGWTVECDSNISLVTFGPQFSETSVDSNNFAVLKDNNSLDFYNFNEENVECLFKCSLSEFITVEDSGFKMTQLFWQTTDNVLGICKVKDKTNIFIMEFDLGIPSVKNVKLVPVQDEFIGLCHHGDEKEILFQTSHGKLMTYSLSTDNLLPHSFHFPEPCFEMDSYCKDNEIYVCGLTSRSRFYINDQEVANNINSFLIHSDFLLLTTLHHQLLCCPVATDLGQNPLFGKGENRSQLNSTVSSRKLERGSKLITAVSCDSRVILQLPRGNLETIQPRALSLKLIGNFLDNCQYYQAFDLMRKQRINLNLLYDHNPQKFIDNIEVFINQVTNVSWLNLFISDLENQDVTTTMYSTSYTHRTELSKCVGEKIYLVCEILRRSLEKLNEKNRYFLPIITTFVKMNDVKDLERALILIKQLQTQPGESVVTADEALKYLLYMVNVDTMYDIALGLYDFDLVMLVASKSQKDPKEYIPFLNNLKAMDEKYRNFKIDDALKRYESALKHLVNCGKDNEAELLSYIKKHNLYKAALACISNNDQRFKNIAESFANFLMSHRNYKEAGVMFQRCGELNQALKAFIQASDWRSAMFVAKALELDQSALQKLQSKLLTNLKECKQFGDAFELLMYSKDTSPLELIECCFEGHMFTKIIGVCAIFNQLDLMKSYVYSNVVKHYEALLSLVVQNEELFINQKSRLLIVREIKNNSEELGEEGVEDCDLYSDTSSTMASNISRSSGRTFRSSKNRRKHERKLVSLKEGSKFEDIALIRSLYGLITTTFNLRTDVNEMCCLLQWLNKDQEMYELQNALDRILIQMNNSTSAIWTPDLWLQTNKDNTDVSNSNQGLHELPDGSSLEPRFKIPPVIQQINWKIQSLNYN